MTNSESLQKLAKTSHELHFSSEELHTSLITYSDDLLTYDAEASIATIEIIDDSTISINGISLALGETQRFVFNALRLNQGYNQTSAQLRSLGYFGASETFNGSIRRLRSFFEEHSDVPIIDRQRANGTKRAIEWEYALLPDIGIRDRRDEDASDKTRLLQTSVVFAENGLPALNDKKEIVFKSPRQRIATTRQMVCDFKEIALADQAILTLFGGSTAALDTIDSAKRFYELPELEQEEERALFHKKEQALIAYVSSVDDYSELAYATVTEGIKATYIIFAHHLASVYKYARAYTILKGRDSVQELYQVGAEALLRCIYRTPSPIPGMSFRPMARVAIKDSVILQKKRDSMSGLSFARTNIREHEELAVLISELTEEHGTSPSIEQLSKHTSMGPDKILGLLMLREGHQSLDEILYGTLDSDEIGAIQLPTSEDIEEDYSERELLQQIINLLFDESSGLSLAERAALSTRFGIFHTALAGQEIRLRGNEDNPYIYPNSEEAFQSFTDRTQPIEVLGKTLFGSSGGSFSVVYNRALHKARRLLESHSIADGLGTTYAEQFAADEAERQRIVEVALEIKPDGAIGMAEIKDLYKKGLFSSKKTIEKLFGSIADFQKACGFEPGKKGIITNDAIVAKALQIQADKPLTSTMLDELSAQKQFYSASSIIGRFGSMKQFHEACGFKPARLTNEEVVAKALQIQADKPLTTGQLKQLSADRKFNSRADLVNRFGSIGAFHKACGFGE